VPRLHENGTVKGIYLSPRKREKREEMLIKKICLFFITLSFFYCSTYRSPSNPRLSLSFDESGNCCDEAEVSTFT